MKQTKRETRAAIYLLLVLAACFCLLLASKCRSESVGVDQAVTPTDTVSVTAQPDSISSAVQDSAKQKKDSSSRKRKKSSSKKKSVKTQPQPDRPSPLDRPVTPVKD